MEKTSQDQTKLNILINNKYFVVSLIEILDLLLKKSNEVNLETLDMEMKQNIRLYKDHLRLRKACNALKYGFTSDDKEGFEEGKIIKKVYKTLTNNLNLFFPNPQKELFSLTDSNGAIVTIIPSIDINLVFSNMTDDELNVLWGYMYLMYISAVGMITDANGHRKEGKLWEIVPKIREKIIKMGLMKNGKIFNPFIGLSADSHNYSTSTLYENVEELKPTELSIDTVLQMSGVDKMVDLNHLNDQLKNVKEEDISEATKNITKLLGAENDADINDVCKTLVEGIVSDLKSNPEGGIKNMFETAKSVTEKIGNKIDQNKMAKTAGQLSHFLQNGEENLKNMKDNNGNPIGDNLMNTLQGPLQFIKNYQSDAPPSLEQLQQLMSQMNQMNLKINSKNVK